MKVLIVSPKFHPVIGGGETYVLNSAKLLHDSGVDVSVAVEPNQDRNLADYSFKVYEVPGLSDSNLDITLASAGLQALIKTLAPDIIHAHGYFALLAVGLSCDNYPIIASIHSTPVWGQRLIGTMGSFEAELNFARKILDMTRPELLTAANEVYASAARKVVKEKIDVKVVPYPVDIDFFYHQKDLNIRRQVGVKQTDRLILTPSRIIERKGIKEVVGMLDYLPDNYYVCLSAAFDPLDKNFWTKVVNSQVYKRNKNRILIPSKSFLYDEMPSLYAACDMVVMPSYYEGAPVATVEAMASGKPFIGADSQGINSFIEDRQNGLLVPQKTFKELAEAVLLLGENKKLGQKLGQQAHDDILYLGWPKQLPVLLKLYQDVQESKQYKKD